ncbi:O-methyltransferase [Corynebacterium sp.]|uniref:O-methyltransferase n=1 Tax=Corynebacterium sp. TaxID=1720 RepID=UPI0026DB97D2|nr:class I SAM-dependent methyltransferase [Corynebacterium sp.]MDO4610331.1 class I SAM-dependent methyltransferase [Corynebacterium sp.]
MTDSAASAHDALRAHAAATATVDEALSSARADATEYGIAAPDAADGELLAMLTSLATVRAPGGAEGRGPAAIAITPAAGIVGLHVFAGMPVDGHLTCIDPDTEHQKLARSAFRAAGIGTGRYRFMPARPLQVMGRLAPGNYDFIYVDVPADHVAAMREAAWPLLGPGGVLVIAGMTYGDGPTEAVAQAIAAADESFRELDDALLARVPLGRGAAVLRKL